MDIPAILAKFGHPKTTKCVCGKRAKVRNEDCISVDKKGNRFVPNGIVQYACGDSDCESRTGGRRMTRFPDGHQQIMQPFHEYDEY